ncbi:hypothetical protein [Streptomyces poonensis]|nr:hypothetical protein [Streptomyces poonensis]
MDLTINLALLLAVILLLLLFRPVKSRNRWDQLVVVIIAVVLGILIAPTDFGRGVLNGLGQLAQNFS